MKTGNFFLLLLTALLSCTWQTGQAEIIKVNGINYELDDSNMTATIAGSRDYRGVNIHIVRTVKKDKIIRRANGATAGCGKFIRSTTLIPSCGYLHRFGGKGEGKEELQNSLQ